MVYPEAFQKLLRDGFVWFAETEGRSTLHALFDVSAKNQGPGATPFSIQAVDRSLPQTGLSWGAIHEFLYAEHPPLSLMALLAANTARARQARKLTVWIGTEIWPTPFILQQIDKELLRTSLFINPPDHKLLLWTIETALRSRASAAVIAACARMPLALSRRFSLAAASGGTLGLIMRPLKAARAPSAAKSRWQIEPVPCDSINPNFALRLLKLRGRQPLQDNWTIQVPPTNGELHAELSVHTPRKLGSQQQ